MIDLLTGIFIFFNQIYEIKHFYIVSGVVLWRNCLVVYVTPDSNITYKFYTIFNMYDRFTRQELAEEKRTCFIFDSNNQEKTNSLFLSETTYLYNIQEYMNKNFTPTNTF